MNAGRFFAAIACQPLFDVSPVSDLAHLSVIDDIDASGDLLLDRVIHRRLQPLVKGRLIVWLAPIPCDKQFEKIIWTG